ncbi:MULTISPECIES: hypothetical protein [Actinosynnema]|uniref:Uncharacterized protein n=1 Tax=Actinosynnema pretiosum TaxID=42197 RepID=A0A290ZEK8_9PSEU|nr:hypothetical protein [Actinosynnema pretiosum]ATE57402.1 hypothetical protein CNX65_32245 [Actinosynnema pretiosum]
MTTEAALSAPHQLTGEHALRYAGHWTCALRELATVRSLPERGSDADSSLRRVARELSPARLIARPLAVPLPDTTAIRDDADRAVARFGRVRAGSVHAHVSERTVATVAEWGLPSLVLELTGLRVSEHLRMNFTAGRVELKVDSRRFGDLLLVVPLDGGETVVAQPWGVERYEGALLLDSTCTPYGRLSGLALNVGLRRLTRGAASGKRAVGAR